MTWEEVITDERYKYKLGSWSMEPGLVISQEAKKYKY